MLIKESFPKDPIDGTLYESVPGVVYQYSASQNAWIRLEGSNVRPATPLAAGLMPAEDLKKLNTILFPPPQTTISIEGQTPQLKNGIIDIYSADGSIDIVTEPTAKDGNNTIPLPWAIHENTAGIDISLNLNQFVQEIEALGKLKRIQIAGDDGQQGPKGDKGADRVMTGPVGDDGEPGDNAIFPGNLAPETVQFDVGDDQQFRAVVDIETDADNNLVLTRANIGSPSACPTSVKPKTIKSSWLLVIDKKEALTTRLVETIDGQLTCRICTSSLYYLNIDTIIASIKEKFAAKLAELKNTKEQAVREWLKTMATVFNEQKYALCCALNNCESRKRNTDTRRYVEQQQIQAAQADFAVVIDSSEANKLTSKSRQQCSIDETESGDSGQDSRVTYRTECTYPMVTMRLDGALHSTRPQEGTQRKWLTANLPPGDYVIEVIDCCVDLSKAPKAEPVKPAPKPVKPRFDASSGGARRNPPIIISTISGAITIYDPYVVYTDELVQLVRQQKLDWTKCENVQGFVDISDLQAIAPADVVQLADGSIVPTAIYNPKRIECHKLFYKQMADYQRQVEDDYAKSLGWVDTSKVPPQASTSQFSGVASIQYIGNEVAPGSAEVVQVKKIVSIPDLGTWNDLFKARSEYVGTSAAFSHVGGEVQVWIEDADGLPNNNAGEVIIGIRSRKCVETHIPDDPTIGDAIPYIYVYRDTVSYDTMIGRIDPYTTTVTQHENYGYDGTNANIQNGPTLASHESKAFFVRANDGLAFYFVNHTKDTPLETTVSADIEVSDNGAATTHESDEVNEVTKTTDADGVETYAGTWAIDGDSDGVFINGLDDAVGNDWQIKLNASQFGAITRLTANGANGEIVTLARGPNSGPITEEAADNLLCRALRRAANVPAGLGGRYSLGVINRVPNKNFRLCRTLPEWSLGSFIQPEYTYAPWPKPPGAMLCDVKYQKTVGDANCGFDPKLVGDKIDIVILLDHSVSMMPYKDAAPLFLKKFAEFMTTTNGVGNQPSSIRFGLGTFGGNEGRQGARAPGNKHKQGDPYMETDLFDYDEESYQTRVLDAVNEALSVRVGPDEPLYWAVQWAAGAFSWRSDAVHLMLLLQNEDIDKGAGGTGTGKVSSRKGISYNSAIDALDKKKVILNALTNVRNSRNRLTGTYQRIFAMADTTGGSVFDIKELLKQPTLEPNSLDTAWIYDQPFMNVRLGIDINPGGSPSAFVGTGLKSTYNLTGTPGYFTIQGLVRGPDQGFRGAIVNLKSDRTGTAVIATSITDENGNYQFRIPTEFFPTDRKKNVTFTIEAQLYTVFADDIWTIETAKVNNKRKHRLYISGGGYSDPGDEDLRWTTGDETPIAISDTSLITLRAGYKVGQSPQNPSLISDGYYPCGFQKISAFEVSKVNKKLKIKTQVTFSDSGSIPGNDLVVTLTHDTVPCAALPGKLKPAASKISSVTVGAAHGKSLNGVEWVDIIIGETDPAYRALIGATSTCRETLFAKFKRAKFTEVFYDRSCTQDDTGIIVNGGPAVDAEYVHVSAQPMTQETLDGKVTAVVATMLTLPNMSIRPILFNKDGQGVVLNSAATPAQSVWETRSWRIDDINRLIMATNPLGKPLDGKTSLEIKLQDLSSIAFEFLNPPTGQIAFFGEVKVVVERQTDVGRETVLVHISNFEPFKSSKKDPGEIPFVEWVGGTPTEEDFSNYLECYWTIAQAADGVNEPICTQLREYCRECVGTSITVPTEDGTATVEEFDCLHGDMIPLTSYIFTPFAPGDACLMNHTQVEWYNRGWSIKSCCGARVELDGTEWLIVKRSFGVDMSCGGGESQSTRCITQYIERGEGHPAIAWPTLDGEHFAGLPLTGSVRFMRDTALSQQLIDKIASGEAIELRGMTAENVTNTIPLILFPTIV